MTIAIEPDYLGRLAREGDGGRLTIKTVDGSACAHYEHTIAITPNGPEVMTLPGFRFEEAFV